MPQLPVWVDRMERGHLFLEDRLPQLKTKYAQQEQHLLSIYIHLDDLENKSQVKNLKLWGIPEATFDC